MSDLVGQLDIPRYPSFGKKDQKERYPDPRNQEDPIINPVVDEEPGEMPPAEREPPMRMPKEKEPPMTEDDYLDPSKNPMELVCGFQEGEIWT